MMKQLRGRTNDEIETDRRTHQLWNSYEGALILKQLRERTNDEIETDRRTH